MGLSNPIVWFIGVAIVVQLVPGIHGWGQHGHFVTCKIAEGYLSKDASRVVKELLPESAEGELASVCSWADLFAIRSHYHWSQELHFVDTPDFRCNYDYCRDCHGAAGRKNRCVTAAIYNYTTQLASACRSPFSEMRYNLTEALMFLAHFMGDVHQPLHCGFKGDLGGNKIQLHWYRRKANLHHTFRAENLDLGKNVSRIPRVSRYTQKHLLSGVWDTSIIDTALDRFYGSNLSNMIEVLQKNITENWTDPSWETCESNRTVCPNPYASESVSLACKYAYRNATPGSTLGDEYFLSRLPIVEQRLAQGGVRLAATLNRIFNSSCELISGFSRGAALA